jgi:hypothetical protein
MQEYHLDLLGILTLVLRNRYRYEILWNDILNNEELYKLIEDLVNEANNDTKFIGFSSGFMYGYVSAFNDDIAGFLGDTLYDRRIEDYVLNPMADIDAEKQIIRIEYEYDDDIVMKYLGIDESEYFGNKEKYRQEFEGAMADELWFAVMYFDEHMNKLIFKFGEITEFVDPDNKKAFLNRFRELVIDNEDEIIRLLNEYEP